MRIYLSIGRTTEKQTFHYRSLRGYFSFLDKDGKEITILGYTNCDLMEKAVLDNDARYMINIHELFSFKQVIEEPMRVTLDTSTIIDHITTTYLKIF